VKGKGMAKKRIGCLPVLGVFMLLGAVMSGISGNNSENGGTLAQSSSETPKPTRTSQAQTENNAAECAAALKGNERFVAVINAVQSGNYDSTKLVNNMQSIETSLDDAWKTASSSGLQNGLLEQANNIGLARMSLGNGDLASFDYAVTQFIRNAGYFEPYCS
jgi:hypothetical protein